MNGMKMTRNTLFSNPILLRFCVVAAVVFALGLYLASWAEQSVKNKNNQIVNRLILQELDEISREIVTGIGQFEYGLQGLRGAINTVKLNNFNYQNNLDYFQSRDYSREFPGTRGFGVIKKINRSDVSEFTKNAQQDRNADFQIKQLNDPKETLFVIQYIEPEVNNKQAVGLDIGSEQNRRSAAIKSAITNSLQLTGPITLVQANEKTNYGFLLLLPIQKSLSSQQNQVIVSKGNAISGWVYAPLLINEILDAVSDVNENFHISISDLYLNKVTDFYSSETGSELESDIRMNKVLNVFGRKWQISVTPTRDYIQSLALKKPSDAYTEIVLLTIFVSLLIVFIGNSVAKRLDALTRKLRYAAVVKNTTEAIVAVDKDFLILHFNNAARELFKGGVQGATHQRPRLISWLKPYIKQDKLVAFFKQVSRGESLLNKSFEYKEGKGTKHLQVSFIPLMKGNEFLGATVSISDVTKLIELQNKLEVKNDKLEMQVVEKSGEIERRALFQASVLDSSGTAIMATDLTGVITLLNQSALTLFELNQSNTINKTNIIELVQSTFFENGQSLDFEAWVNKQLERQSSGFVTFSTESGNDVPVNLTSSAILDENKQATGYVFMAEDIRETLSLKRHVSLINSALDNSQDLLLWLDPLGNILHINEFAREHLEYKENVSETHSINNIMAFEHGESWESIKHNIDQQNLISIERCYRQRDNEFVPVLISCCLLTIGTETVYYLAAKNISAQKSEQQKLKSALARLDVENKSKTLFMSQMSHELRTPLNITSGMLQMLELTEIDEVQRTSIEGAQHSMKHLTYMIDDIMDLSDAERGVLKLDCSEFVLDEVLNDIGFQLSELLVDKPVEVHFDLDQSLPTKLSGDVKKLRKILLSIATNAVKFTPRGEVIIKIWAKRKITNDLALHFSISDTGIGIKQDQLTKIFELFSQSDNSNSRQYGGLGVGLTIANQFVKLMGGELSVDTEKEVGSTFNFHVYLVEVKSSSKVIPKSLDTPLNILLVDDNLTALNTLGNTIKVLGWQVCVASNAKDAFSLFEQAIADDNRFDLVLLDWKMPDVDGWQLADQIRAITPAEEVPLVIMVSATSRKKLTEKAVESNARLNGFITKPVTRTMLIDVISDAISASQYISPTENTTSGSQPLSGKTVLVVEDNPTNQLIAQTLLESQGAKVVVAEGGLVAIDKLENQAVDFVLMDIQMPDIDGYEATRRIRANQQHVNLPIYAMTANVSDADKQRCYQAGMDGHIAKPFQIKDVVDCIIKETTGTQSLKSVSLANTKLNQCISSEIIDFCKEKQISIEDSLARFNYLSDLYKRTLELFSDDLKVNLFTLKSKQNAQLNQDDHILFHTVKSSSASLGFDQLKSLAKTIEQQIYDNVFEQNPALAETQIESIITLMEQVLEDVEKLLTLFLTQPLENNLVEGKVDFNEGFNTLYQDVMQFNMKAIDSYQQISTRLNELSAELCIELEQNLNKLQFSDAKVQLDALKKRLMEK